MYTPGGRLLTNQRTKIKVILIGQKIKGDLQHDLERIELSPLYFQISNLKEKLKVSRKSSYLVNYDS